MQVKQKVHVEDGKMIIGRLYSTTATIRKRGLKWGSTKTKSKTKRKKERKKERKKKMIQLVGASSPVNHKGLSGLRETFTMGYTVERINKAGIRPEALGEKAEGCRKNLRNEIQLKGP